ncbi:OrdA protein [Crepidotus variabilis]|uniref:OrdA protein n=1 Tax=Crepidotus variabilis TaxID=179855 RepID=A0A9P6EAR0_9AGAR|nr:OrdA protein [Crepidotus variabilis]
MTLVTLLSIAIAGYALYNYISSRKPQGRPLPPGPKGFPVVGNVADLPTEQEWQTYASWGRKWGGLVHISLLGQPLIIVNSYKYLEEFEKKGAIYSDRPTLEMGGELVGYSRMLVLTRYGPRFREYRKHFSRFVGPNPTQELYPLIEQATHKFLKNTLLDPKNLNANLRRMAGGIIMKVAYGYDVKDENDEFVELVERANTNFSKSTVPGAFIVDVFPALKYLPEWLPGMKFLSLAREWRQLTDENADLPFEFTKKQVESGSSKASLVSTGLQEQSHPTKEYIHELKWAAASMYAGGADTTVSAEYAFFLAMVLFPDVQKRAQAEIDAVVGDERLPSLADKPNLPYVSAIITEVLRWNSVGPLGAPHTAMEDGYINGFFVPKDSMIIANLWNMLHDSELYPDPFTFNPERYLGSSPQQDPRKITFGFGRRICPGMYLAEASLFACVAKALATLNVEKALDAQGSPIIPVHEMTDGVISYPKPFQCSIKPRSAKASSLIVESS